MSSVGTRPTEDMVGHYKDMWKQYSEQGNNREVAVLMEAAKSNADLYDFLERQYVAACYLEDLLREMAAPPEYRKEWCFKFGRLCVGRDPWEVFDKVIERCEEDIAKITQRKEWSEVPVPQEVPEYTKLIEQWYDHAKESVGEDGVFPAPFHVKTHDDGVVIVALALGGREVFDHIIEMFRRPDFAPKEAVFGVDMTAMPGQGLLYSDFLAVVWYREGEFYTGVINYQCEGAVDDPAFEAVDWSNNYWSHALRDHPIPQIKEAIEERNVAIRKAEEYGSPPFDDLPFEPLGPHETARLIELMPTHLKGLLVQWGWGDTVLRDSLLEWVLRKVWDIAPDQFYAKDDEGRFKFEPFRDLIEDQKRIKLNLSLLEDR